MHNDKACPNKIVTDYSEKVYLFTIIILNYDVCLPWHLYCMCNKVSNVATLHVVMYVWSAVARRSLNRRSLGSNPLWHIFEACAFSFSPQCHSSLSCINYWLAVDGGGDVTECLCPKCTAVFCLGRFCRARHPAPFWWRPAFFKKLKWRPVFFANIFLIYF